MYWRTIFLILFTNSSELKIVLPGKYEPSAIKIASKTQETTKQRRVNLALITSVVTPKRAFNFEWHNFEDTKEFFSVIEAIMGVTIYKKWCMQLEKEMVI